MKSPRGQDGSRKVNLRDARRAISRRQPGPRPSAPWIRCSSNIDKIVPGTVDEVDGKVTFADASTKNTYGIVDEIARRVILSGGRAIGVRKVDIPGANLSQRFCYAV